MDKPLPRMRVLDAAYQQLKKDDPFTDLTKHALRHMILSGTIPSVRVGRKWLINYDKLLEFLTNPPEAIEDTSEYGKIRRAR